jgi:hypothetical protein
MLASGEVNRRGGGQHGAVLGVVVRTRPLHDEYKRVHLIDKNVTKRNETHLHDAIGSLLDGGGRQAEEAAQLIQQI